MEPPPGAAFVTTHWSVVLTAGRSDTTRAQNALAKLCQAYWRPLYAYVRRRGYSTEDAQDLTQEFFARLLERKTVSAASPDKGHFRSFLLASLNHFLSDELDKARAQKRGAGKVVSLDTESAQTLLRQQPSKGVTPEQAYELRWAITLLEQFTSEWRRNIGSRVKWSCLTRCERRWLVPAIRLRTRNWPRAWV
jgi:RNA polymerase sigma-70 factor (ECF subfamily)